MRRVWRTVVNTLKGAGGGSGSDTSRVRRLDDTIASATAQLRGTTADVASVNPRIDGVLQLPVKEIVKGRSRLEIRKLANAAFNGEGTTKDEVKATHLWVVAGMQGDAESMYSLAMCFIKGNGLPAPDPARGRTILQELAKQNHGWSAFSLSSLLTRDVELQKARGETPDRRTLRKAFRLCKQAAEADVAPAFLNLFNMYEEGTGTSVNKVAALGWLKRAAQSGDPQAQAVLAARLSKGVGMRKDEKLGFELYLTSAASGKPQSLYNVACAYFMGKPVPRDLAKAAYYFRQSAEAGFYPAMMNLGNMLQYGQGVPVDFDEALRWYTEAAKHSEDAHAAIAQLKVRMASDVDHSLPEEVARTASTAFTERVSEHDGGRGVLYELENPKANAPTLDVKLDVSSPEEGEAVMREIREAGATTAAEVMEVLERRVARGATLVRAVMKDADGKVVADNAGSGAGETAEGASPEHVAGNGSGSGSGDATRNDGNGTQPNAASSSGSSGSGGAEGGPGRG